MIDAATATMEQFWTHMHARNDGPALTGSSMASMFNTLGIPEDRVPPGTRLLEIGVGMGHATKSMAAHGIYVSVLDICQQALDRVGSIVQGAYLHRDAANLPDNWFDLATSLLVTQHMSEADILWQFPHAFRALKADGLFVIQWAGSRIAGENDNPEAIIGEYGKQDEISPVGMICGRMVRSEAYATALIERCGGEVLEIRGHREFPEFASYWYVTECRRSRG